MTDLAFSCRCGGVTGRIRDAGPHLGQGTHVHCRCWSCRTAHLHIGEPDPAPEGVDLYQTDPARLVIDSGQDKLAVFRVTPRGAVYRYYATCCKSALFTCATKPWMPVMSVATKRLADPAAIGPSRATAFIPKPGGGYRTQGAVPLVWGVFARWPHFLRKGGARHHPLFDAAGAPIAPVHVMTSTERAAANAG